MNVAKMLTAFCEFLVDILDGFQGMGRRFIVFVVSCDNKYVFEEGRDIRQKGKV